MTDDGTIIDEILEKANKHSKYLFNLVDEKLDEICKNESMALRGALCQAVAVKILSNCMLVINLSKNTQEIKDQYVEIMLKDITIDVRNIYEQVKREAIK